MIKKILFPTDFSRLSKEALAYCCHLAAKLDAEILGIYALKLPQPVYTFTSPPESEHEALREESARRLKDFFSHPGLKDLKVEHRLGLGLPHQVINETAAKEKADWILVAKHSLTTVERFFVGSVAERILRRMPCPVLVFPDHGVKTVKWSPVVCAVDFSHNSIEALEYSVRLAAACRAELALVHVVEVEPEVSEAARAQISRLIEQARDRLRKLAETSGARRDVRVVVEEGKPGVKLLEAATRLGSDLLIVGRRGEYAPKGMGAGSVAYGILRASTLPVLIVP